MRIPALKTASNPVLNEILVQIICHITPACMVLYLTVKTTDLNAQTIKQSLKSKIDKVIKRGEIQRQLQLFIISETRDH